MSFKLRVLLFPEINLRLQFPNICPCNSNIMEKQNFKYFLWQKTTLFPSINWYSFAIICSASSCVFSSFSFFISTLPFSLKHTFSFFFSLSYPLLSSVHSLFSFPIVLFFLLTNMDVLFFRSIRKQTPYWYSFNSIWTVTWLVQTPAGRRKEGKIKTN